MHRWHFTRAGNVDQVSLRSGSDLAALADLDQKLWMVLAMPTKDVDVDAKTLALLDRDGDGRIRVPDIVDAARWIAATWSNPDTVLKGGETLSLDTFKAGPVLVTARRVLGLLGKSPDARAFTVDEAASILTLIEGTTLNGDGVIVPGSSDDAAIRALIEEMITAGGSVTDRSGKPGIDQAKADAFFAAIDARAAWQREGAGLDKPETRAAAEALAAVHAKLEDHFTRTRIAEVDARAAAALSGAEADFAALAASQLTTSTPELRKLPLAKIAPGHDLPLHNGVNPAWADALAAFADHAVKPILGGRDRLNADDFKKLIAALAPYNEWLAKKPTTIVDGLPEARVTDLAAGAHRKRIAEVIAADLELAAEYGSVADVVKAARFQRDFAKVLRNFVNFSDFYSKRDGAFQCGTLYLDGRAFNLTVPVADAGKHAALAGMSAAYLVYCDIVRGGEKRQIASAVTNGDGDNLFVGRNGVFYDRAGNDWDATITKIIDNPISVRQAFWSPYKKLVRLVEEQFAKRAADAEAKSSARVEGAATSVATVDQKPAAAAAAAAVPPADAKPAAKKGLDIGIIAVISLAISAVVGALAGMIAMLVGMGAWMPLGIVALLLAISGPSMLLAWMKLRRRNLGPILDANGWAVNTRARVNVAFGAALTDLATLPPGASRSLDDPFADKRRPWKLYMLLVVFLTSGALWYAGKLDRYVPQSVKSTTVLGKNAPANN